MRPPRLSVVALLALALGCANAYNAEENTYEAGKMGQRDRCNLPAAQRCQGASDWDACMEREAGACDARVDNEVDPNQIDSIPPSLSDDEMLSEPGDPY